MTYAIGRVSLTNACAAGVEWWTQSGRYTLKSASGAFSTCAEEPGCNRRFVGELKFREP